MMKSNRELYNFLHLSNANFPEIINISSGQSTSRKAKYLSLHITHCNLETAITGRYYSISLLLNLVM